MEETEEQLLIELPDGTMALATKVQPPEQAYLICWSCRTHLVYEKGANMVKCGVCGNLNGTAPASQSVYRILPCLICGNLMRAPVHSNAIRCPYCCQITLVLT